MNAFDNLTNDISAKWHGDDEIAHRVDLEDFTVYAITAPHGEITDLNAQGEAIETTDELRAFVVELHKVGAYDDDTMQQLLCDTITDDDAAGRVVVNDGQVVWAAMRADLRPDDSEEAIRAGDSDSYRAFCDAVPHEARLGDVGSAGCIAWCHALMDAGADIWDLR